MTKKRNYEELRKAFKSLSNELAEVYADSEVKENNPQLTSWIIGKLIYQSVMLHANNPSWIDNILNHHERFKEKDESEYLALKNLLSKGIDRNDLNKVVHSFARDSVTNALMVVCNAAPSWYHLPLKS